MSAHQYFPLSHEMFALACETVSRRVSRLPFLRSGVTVSGELIGVAMECLNAEFNKTLALYTPQNTIDSLPDGLDRCIEERLNIPGKSVVPVIADVLCSAGIAEPAELIDRASHRSGKESGCAPRGPGMRPRCLHRWVMMKNPPPCPG